jgi:hypothetical protein
LEEPSKDVIKDAMDKTPNRQKNNQKNKKSNKKAVQHHIAPPYHAGPVIHIHNGPGAQTTGPHRPHNPNFQGRGTGPPMQYHPNHQGRGGGNPRRAYNMNVRGGGARSRAPMEDPEASEYYLGSSMAQSSRYVF